MVLTVLLRVERWANAAMEQYERVLLRSPHDPSRDDHGELHPREVRRRLAWLNDVTYFLVALECLRDALLEAGLELRGTFDWAEVSALRSDLERGASEDVEDFILMPSTVRERLKRASGGTVASALSRVRPVARVDGVPGGT